MLHTNTGHTESVGDISNVPYVAVTRNGTCVSVFAFSLNDVYTFKRALSAS